MMIRDLYCGESIQLLIGGVIRMKTTVRRFILENMTDTNYEKLVNMLIIESVRMYDFEIADKITEDIDNQRLEDKENNASEKLHLIEKRFNVKGEFTLSEEELPFDPSEMMVTNRLEGDSEKARLESVDMDLELDVHIKPSEVDFSNYKEFIVLEKVEVDSKLSKFIYDIMHHNSDKKMKNDFEQFSHEKSYVKIAHIKEVCDGYCVYFLLDNRTRYISSDVRLAYLSLTDSNSSVTQPRFVGYDELQEDLSMYQNEHMLAPFTSYLNEEITIPEGSEEVLYDLLSMFIHIFTHQGFTEKEQIEEIKYFDEHYDRKLV